MNRHLRIAARVAAPPGTETSPIDAAPISDIVQLLKRQLDMLVQAASRNNVKRSMKLLEDSYSALQTLMALITKEHEEVEKSRELVEDKADQLVKKIRPIRLQVH